MATMIITNTGASGTIGSMKSDKAKATTKKKHQVMNTNSKACSG
ncbi:MAG TPA: hypothetical protein VJV79_38530 [Polyangiaceae bacterium]|nr:hypothetical protein [Polyangiaceae bacterium]